MRIHMLENVESSLLFLKKKDVSIDFPYITKFSLKVGQFCPRKKQCLVQYFVVILVVSSVFYYR